MLNNSSLKLILSTQKVSIERRYYKPHLKLRQFGNVALHTWCTPGAHPSAHLVHTWCTPGEQWSHGAHPNNEHLVHTWCTPGAPGVHWGVHQVVSGTLPNCQH